MDNPILRLSWDDVILEPEKAAAAADALDADFRWTPEHFPLGGTRWYAGRTTDNKAHEHVAPMNTLVRDALERARPDIVSPGVGVFASPNYSLFRDWLDAAEKLAKLPHLKGGGWHPFRRGWATARKHYPSQDVARAGGWRDTATMERCYAREDAETILAVVNGT